MAYTTIDKPSDYFDSVLYTGNTSTGTTINSLDFAPNMVWFKSRTQAENHQIYDSVRGVTKRIIPNGTQAEATASTGLTNFDSNGFRTGGENETDSGNIVAWNWKAGTSFTNDASATGIGSIDSTGSFNNDSGFSIVSYTGTGSNGTVKHGLTSAPKHIIIKRRDALDQWIVYHNSIGNTGGVYLNLTNAAVDNNTWFNDTSPTSTVFSIGTNDKSNASSGTYIAYCFAEKQGYSKFGSYVGIASSDSNFVFLGFKPAFLLIKNTSSNSTNWHMYDNKRLGYNVDNNMLRANLNNASQTDDDIDLLSNGFKLRRSTSALNNSGDTFIYYAVAENPFTTSTGVPATAR